MRVQKELVTKPTRVIKHEQQSQTYHSVNLQNNTTEFPKPRYIYIKEERKKKGCKDTRIEKTRVKTPGQNIIPL